MPIKVFYGDKFVKFPVAGTVPVEWEEGVFENQDQAREAIIQNIEILSPGVYQIVRVEVLENVAVQSKTEKWVSGVK